ncbi:MAG: hypothetical protein ABIG63_03355 [Chloroflexota bacterium]
MGFSCVGCIIILLKDRLGLVAGGLEEGAEVEVHGIGGWGLEIGDWRFDNLALSAVLGGGAVLAQTSI